MIIEIRLHQLGDYQPLLGILRTVVRYNVGQNRNFLGSRQEAYTFRVGNLPSQRTNT